MFDPGVPVHRRGDYVWGSFVRTPEVDGWIHAINPGDRDDILARFPFGLRNVDDAVGAARRGAASLMGAELAARNEAVRTLANRLEEEADGLAVLITRETGKPLWESAGEVQSTLRGLRRLATHGPSVLERTVMREGATWSQPSPHGVVGLITPWTQPILLPALWSAAAILAGNAVVLKPSKFAPGTGQALAESMDRLRLPRGAFNLVQGPGSQIGHRMATHRGIDALAFAGRSATARRLVERDGHRSVMPMMLHTGGKGVAVVLRVADIQLSAWEITVGAFVSAGQRHDATARVVVVRSQADALIQRLTVLGRRIRVGYGFDDDVFMGPMISDSHRRAYRKQLDRYRQQGLSPALEGREETLEGRRGFYVRPDIRWRDGVGDRAAVPTGPALEVWVVDDEDEALEVVGSLTHRGVASLFGSGDRLAKLATGLPFGSVHVNRGTLGGSLRLSAVPRGEGSNGWPAGLDVLRFFAPGRAVVVDSRPLDGSRQVPGLGGATTQDSD